MAEAASVEKWIEKIGASHQRYAQRVEKIKEEVRADEELSELERSVLGATGSIAELERYKGLSLRIGQLMGQPIVVLEQVGSGRVKRAQAGVISGPLEASRTYARDKGHIKDGFSSATLRVPVTPGVVYQVSDALERTCSDPLHPKRLFFDDESSLYDREQEQSFVTVGRFSTVYRRDTQPLADTSFDPYQNFDNKINFDSVLAGREAIYESPLFTHGISEILLAL